VTLQRLALNFTREGLEIPYPLPHEARSQPRDEGTLQGGYRAYEGQPHASPGGFWRDAWT
jgi:hypothetical protein